MPTLRPRLWISVALVCLSILGCNGARWPAINNPPTDLHSPGRWIWAELFTADPDASRDFYSKVFGWTFEQQANGKYILVRAGERPIAAMVHHLRLKKNQRSAQWLRLMSVRDLRRAVEQATDGGGKVVLAPRHLKGLGEAAVLADPEGALFGVIHSDSGDPPDLFPAVDTWLWNELWADDVERMAAFYQEIGDLEVRVPPSDKTLAPDRPEVFLVVNRYPRAGIVEQQREELPSAWLPYVRVRDLRATLERALQAGGTPVIEPDPEIRAGRVAVFTDPLGAAVGIAEWPRESEEKE